MCNMSWIFCDTSVQKSPVIRDQSGRKYINCWCTFSADSSQIFWPGYHSETDTLICKVRNWGKVNFQIKFYFGSKLHSALPWHLQVKQFLKKFYEAIVRFHRPLLPLRGQSKAEFVAENRKLKIPKDSLELSWKTSEFNLGGLCLARVRAAPRGLQRGAHSQELEGRWHITQWLWKDGSAALGTTLGTLYLQMTDVSLEDTAEYHCTGSSALEHRLVHGRVAWWQQLTQSHSPEGWHPVCIPSPQVLLPHFYPFTSVPDLFLWRNATLCRGWGGPVTRIPQRLVPKLRKLEARLFPHLATKPFLPLHERASLLSLQYLLLHLLLLVFFFFFKLEHERIALSL